MAVIKECVSFKIDWSLITIAFSLLECENIQQWGTQLIRRYYIGLAALPNSDWTFWKFYSKNAILPPSQLAFLCFLECYVWFIASSGTASAGARLVSGPGRISWSPSRSSPSAEISGNCCKYYRHNGILIWLLRTRCSFINSLLKHLIPKISFL